MEVILFEGYNISMAKKFRIFILGALVFGGSGSVWMKNFIQSTFLVLRYWGSCQGTRRSSKEDYAGYLVGAAPSNQCLFFWCIHR
jgi:hypothetical protein